MINNMYEIIKSNFDARCDAMVIAYLFDKGIEFCKSITDEDINSLEGNGLMTEEFVQSMVKTASIIAKECSMFDDIIPYVADRFYVEEEEDE